MRRYLLRLLLSLCLMSLAPLWSEVQAAPGDYLFQWGAPHLLTHPGGVAIDSAGNSYVTEFENHRVRVFDGKGNLVRTWGSFGSGNGQLSYPLGLALSGNLVYVADSGNNRVEVFDTSGKFVRTWGSYGLGDTNFNYPVKIAIGSDGRVYVADAGNSRIKIFDGYGNFIKSIGESGSGGGEFVSLGDLALDASNNIWVVDTFHVSLFDSGGTFLKRWDMNTDLPHTIAVGSSGNIYVSVASYPSGADFKVQIYDVSGNLLKEWGSFGFGPGQFDDICDLAIDSSGNVHAAEIGNNRVQVFDSGGAYLKKVGGTDGDGQLNFPQGIAVDPIGNVVVADQQNHRVQVFDSNGNFVRKFSDPGGTAGQFTDPAAVAVDGAGKVYVTDYVDISEDRVPKIEVFDSSGKFLRSWDWPPYSFDFGVPGGIAVAASGNVYVANAGHCDILIFDNNGSQIGTWGSCGTGNGMLRNPYGLAFDGAGNLYVADRDNYRIQVFSSSGSFLRAWGSQGSSDGQFYNPTWVAVDGAGNVYVTDIDEGGNSSRIQVFDGSGKFLGKWGSHGSGSGQFLIPAGVAASLSGATAYVVDTDNHRVEGFAGYGDQLPQGWVGRDVGSVGVKGRASFANGSFMVQGSGADIWGTADAFHYVFKPLVGDGQIIARVTALQNTNTYAKGGVMIRQSLAANAMHATMDLWPGGGAEFSRRTTTGGTTSNTTRSGQSLPYWVKLVRSGNTFTGYVSSDGGDWILVGCSTIYMSGTVYVGLIANSHANGVLTTASLDHVSTAGDTTAPTVTAFTIPATSRSLTVPITTLTASDNVGVTGYLVNESATRPAATASGWSGTKPGSYTFSSTGTRTLYAWAKDAAGNVSSSRSATVTVSGGALPAPWQTQDIGSVGLAGSAGYLNGTFTLKGSGADIWGTADAFRFVYRVMNGDGQLIARVASVQNTNSYAKSGVMMRQSLAANSAHAAIDIWPTGSAEFLRRTTTGGNTSNATRSGISAPYWVKLVRSGNTFTGSVSSDGVTWVQVGSSTISMSNSIYVGLIVNSHNNSVVCTTTIDSVK